MTDDKAIEAFAELTGTGTARDIPEVLDRLDAMQKFADTTFARREGDGFACFTRLYRIITATIGEWEESGKFEAPDGFLTHLDVEFAERYFEAIRTYAHDRAATPGCWRVLFDLHGDARIPEASFAAAGVNAHIDFDLSAALLRTWERNSPDVEGHRDLQHRDFDKINAVFAQHMDELRKKLHTVVSEELDGSVVDFLADLLGDGIVVATRAMAWEIADLLWRFGDHAKAVERSDHLLGVAATHAGTILLRIRIP